MGDNRQVVKTYDATGRELHVDVPLSQLWSTTAPKGPRRDDLPVVNVTKQSDMIPVIPLGEFLRKRRRSGTRDASPHGPVQRGDHGYYCKNYALKYPIT